MLGDLSKCTDQQLVELADSIQIQLDRRYRLSAYNLTELAQVEKEIERRVSAMDRAITRTGPCDEDWEWYWKEMDRGSN